MAHLNLALPAGVLFSCVETAKRLSMRIRNGGEKCILIDSSFKGCFNNILHAIAMYGTA